MRLDQQSRREQFRGNVTRDFERLKEEHQNKQAISQILDIELSVATKRGCKGKSFHTRTTRKLKELDSLRTMDAGLFRRSDDGWHVIPWGDLTDELTADPKFKRFVLYHAKKRVSKRDGFGDAEIIVALTMGRVDEVIEKCGQWYGMVEFVNGAWFLRSKKDYASKPITSWTYFMDQREIRRDTNEHLLGEIRTAGELKKAGSHNETGDKSTPARRPFRQDRGLGSVDKHPLELSSDKSLTPEEACMANERMQILCAAIAALPARDANVVKLKLFEYLSFQEIGHVFGLSPAGAQRNYLRAIEMLKAALSGQSELSQDDD